MNQPVYKCYNYKILDHLDPFFPDKFKRSKGSNHIPFITTNTVVPKKIWVPKVTPNMFLYGCFAAFMKH